MTDSTPAASGSAPDQCRECGGSWTAGRIAVPIVGSLRFVYRLGTNEVSTEVAADLCGNCGHVRLRARDPKLIEQAGRAARYGRPTTRWGLPKQSWPAARRRPEAQEG
jgi:hypothetical protein